MMKMERQKDHSQRAHKPKHTVKDLTPETRKLVERVYADDFALGGCVTIEKTAAKAAANTTLCPALN